MIDTHAHILKEYYSNIEEVIARMKDNIVIVSGTNLKNNKEVIKLIKKYDNVFGTIGIHPEEAEKDNREVLAFIEKNIDNPKIVGIGEIGLDYYYDVDKERQRDLFIKQIQLANKYKKTIVIHTREAIQETYDILKKYKNEDIKINIHCFSGSKEMAKKFIGLNAKLGISGVLTFKNNKNLVEIVEEIDIKYLLLETDSPFLSPEPYRGKINEPYNVLYVAKKIAEIKGETLEKVLEITTENAKYQFDLN